MIQLETTVSLGNIEFAAFDLETTGMDPVRDEIIEIGITVFRRHEVLRSVSHLVNPTVPISDDAFKVHGIHQDVLKDKPRVNDILPEIVSLLSTAIPVAHNASFDISFLIEAALKAGVPFPVSSVVDSCLMAKKLFPDFPTHRLTYLVEKFGLNCEQAHRALSDANCCYSLFRREVEELPLKWETRWEEFCFLSSGVLSLDASNFQVPAKLDRFKDDFANHRRVILSYQDGKGEVTRREVTPMGFSADGNKSILIGYCHLRHGTRSFRLDRILDVEGAQDKGAGPGSLEGNRPPQF